MIVRLLLRWYRRRGRALPWRATRDPYRILISEVMLQQTQVARVLKKYPVFLGRFPTLRALGRAAQRDVVTAWSGMGYNNRAVRLHRLAHIVVTRHRGRIPRDEKSLLSLPGIGPCTAAAIRSSAFREPVPLVDVNVRRVLSRISRRMTSPASVRSDREIRLLARRMLPVRAAFAWNQALMDLGAMICTGRAPRCGECPLAMLCPSRGRMNGSVRRPARVEPSRAGIPNRIYRGRIVEHLRRAARGRGMDTRELGRAVLPGFSGRDAAWLRRLLAGLERDDLVLIRREKVPSESRVTLK